MLVLPLLLLLQLCRATTLYVNEKNWTTVIAPYVQWQDSEPCNDSMRVLLHTSWPELDSGARDEVFFCLVKQFYLSESRTASYSYHSPKCHSLFTAYNYTAWQSIDAVTQRLISDCIWMRVFIDALHHV